MGADIKSLRNRIKSVDSTLHLTKAMGLVASSKIKRATLNMQKSKQYYEALNDAVQTLIVSSECRKSEYLKESENGKICLIVIAGDRGLAGGYNSNVFKCANEFSGADIIPIGKRSVDKFGGELFFAEGFKYEDALYIAKKLCEDFKENKYSKIGIVYTKYISMMTQTPLVKWILPLSFEVRLFHPFSLTFSSSPSSSAISNLSMSSGVLGLSFLVLISFLLYKNI